MDPLTAAIVVTTAFVIFAIAILAGVSRRRARTVARVEALQALVEESGSLPAEALAEAGQVLGSSLVRRSFSEGGGSPDPDEASARADLSATASAPADLSAVALAPADLSAVALAEADWDRLLHAEGYDDVPDYDDAPEVTRPIAAPVAAPASVRVVATTPQFVVHVPDSSGAHWQVSFQHKESQS